METCRRPTLIARRLNPLVTLAAGSLGLATGGVMVLYVRRRVSGRCQRVPLNVFVHQGAYHLVSLYGESDWVRNLRAAGAATLVRGRRRIPVLVAEEIAVEDRPRVLRVYLMHWNNRFAKSLAGPDGTVDEDDLREIAAMHPVFRLKLG